jgi:hypothetical protein
LTGVLDHTILLLGFCSNLLCCVRTTRALPDVEGDDMPRPPVLVVFLALRKQFVYGLTLGSTKG